MGRRRSARCRPSVIRGLARRMAAKRTLRHDVLVAAAGRSRRAVLLGGGDARLGARPDRPARRRCRLRLRRGQRHRRRRGRARAADAARGQEPGDGVHSRGPHQRDAGEPGRPLRLQRPAAHLPGRADHLLGRRQPVPSSPGPRPPGARLAAAGDDHRPRALVESAGALRRHRAAGDDDARAQRLHRLGPRLLRARDAQGRGALRRSAQRSRHLRGDSPSGSVFASSSPRGAASASGSWRCSRSGRGACSRRASSRRSSPSSGRPATSRCRSVAPRPCFSPISAPIPRPTR